MRWYSALISVSSEVMELLNIFLEVVMGWGEKKAEYGIFKWYFSEVLLYPSFQMALVACTKQLVLYYSCSCYALITLWSIANMGLSLKMTYKLQILQNATSAVINLTSVVQWDPITELNNIRLAGFFYFKSKTRVKLSAKESASHDCKRVSFSEFLLWRNYFILLPS